MKVLTLLGALILYGLTGGAQPQTKRAAATQFASVVKGWFAAWERVSTNYYHRHQVDPVCFVFFDATYVYSTSLVTIPEGVSIHGPDLMKRRLIWKMVPHGDSLRLPDHSVIPVGLAPLAMPLAGGEAPSFFVLPLPSYWKAQGIVSKELGLEKLVTGVFLHEFTHTQQMKSLGKRVDAIAQKRVWEVPFSDNLIQDLFSKDAGYVQTYQKEVSQLYKSSEDARFNYRAARDAMDLVKQRQAVLLQKSSPDLKEGDALFLTMEGLGQYTMFLWLTDPVGGKLPRQVAIEGVRRKRKSWSQEEGFALFLLLDRLVSPQQGVAPLFGQRPLTILDLLQKYLFDRKTLSMGRNGGQERIINIRNRGNAAIHHSLIQGTTTRPIGLSIPIGKEKSGPQTLNQFLCVN